MPVRIAGLCCGLLCLFVSVTARAELSSDDQTKLASLHAGLPVRSLEPASCAVGRWTNEDGQGWRVKAVEVKAAAIYVVDEDVYVVKSDDGHWLRGTEHDVDGKPGVALIDGAEYDNLDRLVAERTYPPLPNAPEGWTLSVFATPTETISRLARDVDGRTVYALGLYGNVYAIDPDTGVMKRLVHAKDYIGAKPDFLQCMGLAFDAKRRLYVTSNVRNDEPKVIQNEVTIYRSQPLVGDETPKMEPWLVVSYPFGINQFNHGVGHIALGPDGMLYVNSGSRTDANEPGDNERYSPEGETDITACLWRLDPDSDEPQVEVFARGLRNAYGFCWDERDRMFATDNGPNKNPPEELNLIEQGRHYGFPYRFSDWDENPYAHVGPAPEGLTFTDPIKNIGPDAGGSAGSPLSTFDPHSCPVGIVYLDEGFPGAYHHAFLTVRYGVLIGPTHAGFDLLHVRLIEEDGQPIKAEVTQMLHPLGRPVDVLLGDPGVVYICEYGRTIDNRGHPYRHDLPGRILEMRYQP